MEAAPLVANTGGGRLVVNKKQLERVSSMSLEVNLEGDGIGAVFTYSGVIGGEEAIGELQKLYNNDSSHRLRYRIVDMREAIRMEIESQQLQQIALLDNSAAKHVGGFVIASVVNHELQKVLSQFYRTYVVHDLVDVDIFESMDEARLWIKERLQHRDSKVEAELTSCD